MPRQNNLWTRKHAFRRKERAPKRVGQAQDPPLESLPAHIQIRMARRTQEATREQEMKRQEEAKEREQEAKKQEEEAKKREAEAKKRAEEAAEKLEREEMLLEENLAALEQGLRAMVHQDEEEMAELDEPLLSPRASSLLPFVRLPYPYGYVGMEREMTAESSRRDAGNSQ